MPSRLAAPVLSVSINDIAKVDTTNVDNLFTMWTIFSKCADSLENGRRLENLSWRLWNRETFCVAEEGNATSTSATVPAIEVKPVRRDTTDTYSDMPALSESVDSVSSDCATSTSSTGERHSGSIPIERPTLMRRESSRGREKHMTPVHLAKLVDNMRGDDLLTSKSAPSCKTQKVSATPIQTSAPTSHFSKSEEMATSEQSTHSIVRGFSPSNISSSMRSTRPVTPEPITPASLEQKTKKPMFIIGSTSSDGSYMEEHHTFRTQPETGRKRTSFKEEVVTRTVYDDDDMYTTEEEVDESAIEEDDDDWESGSESGSCEYDQSNMFARVEERPQLPSRRSLLSTLLHEPSRAAQLANSTSTPQLRSSRTSPQGPSVAPSPSQDCPLTIGGLHIAASRPIMATTTVHPPALSPRTTRRNMLATELTESLRQNLLWERKQKDTTATAVLKRRHTAHDNMSKLTEYPQLSHMSSKETSKNNSWNHFFDGFHEYHVAGW